MTRLFLIRHGATEWNAEARAQGSKNIQLSPVGKHQAYLLSKRMEHYKIDSIYSSDLDRAYETAIALGNRLGIEVKKNNNLREMSFGKWEGLTNQEIQTNYKDYYTIWRGKPHKAIIPDGEKLMDVQKRALKAIHDIVKNNEGKNIVIVSHGVTIKAIILGIMDIELSNFYKIRQDNACINILEYMHYGPVLVSLNDTAHLNNEYK